MKEYANDISMIFWKYFDLYCHKKLSMTHYVEKRGFTYQEIKTFLSALDEKNQKYIEES